jgi:hypothetical protein
VGSETIEMAVENLDVGAFQGRIEDCFPEVFGIDLMRTTAEKLDQMMDAIRGAVGKLCCIVTVSMHYYYSPRLLPLLLPIKMYIFPSLHSANHINNLADTASKKDNIICAIPPVPY